MLANELAGVAHLASHCTFKYDLAVLVCAAQCTACRAHTDTDAKVDLYKRRTDVFVTHSQ